MKLNILFCFLFLFLSCTNQKNREVVIIPVIHLDPDQVDTLRYSNYFDRMSVVLLQGETVEYFSDFVELADGYVASVRPGRQDAMHLYVYDKNGNFQNQVGTIGRGPGERLEICNSLQVDKDGIIQVIDKLKYLKYNLAGEVLQEEQLYPLGKEMPHVGSFSYAWNDSLFMSFNVEMRAGSRKMLDYVRKYNEKKNMCTIYSLNTHQIKNTFFPLKGLCDQVFSHHLYKYKDTLRLHHDSDGRIYDIFPDQVIPRYRMDKGKYDRVQTVEEEFESYGKNISLAIIFMSSCNETDKYVWGKYFFKDRFYTYVYDKKTGITKNYRVEIDDVGHLINLKTANASWETGMCFKEEYLWRKYTYDFVDIIGELKSTLSEEEWGLYGREHPDVLRIYKLLDNEVNGGDSNEILGDKVVLVRYHFK